MSAIGVYRALEAAWQAQPHAWEPRFEGGRMVEEDYQRLICEADSDPFLTEMVRLIDDMTSEEIAAIAGDLNDDGLPDNIDELVNRGLGLS